MKKVLILLSITLLLFSGCSQRQIVQKEIVCVEQYEYPFGEKIKARVHPKDAELLKARSEYLEEGFKFYKGQVERNNSLCKKDEK